MPFSVSVMGSSHSPSSATVCVEVTAGATITHFVTEKAVSLVHTVRVSGLLVSILLSDIQLDPKCHLNGWLEHQLKMVVCLKAPSAPPESWF